jgi:putative aldouronate transport system permease protein
MGSIGTAKSTDIIYKKNNFFIKLAKNFKTHKFLYFMSIPIIAYYIVFCYLPMYGVIIAFKDFKPALGIIKSPWVGLKYFIDFFSSFYFWRLVKNTVLINIYDLIFGFPVPIIFALLLNELRGKYFKKTVQTVTYLPHFISTVVICGILIIFSEKNGVLNDILSFFGAERGNLLAKPENFRALFVGSNIWTSFGWDSIIYLAALSNIDQSLYEAAMIDGCNKWKQTIYITLPGISKTIIILLILRIGSLMSVGWEKIILLYNPLTYETADVISTFTYRRGIVGADYSYSAAVGLFNSGINFILIIIANTLSKKFNETSLW